MKTLKEQFNIEIIFKDFLEEKSLDYSEHLKNSLEMAKSLRPKSEKAKSEWIISPILLEVKRLNKEIFIFSGENLDVDAERNLNGECDFIFTKNNSSLIIEAPILGVVEAKRDAISSGDIAQAIAQMIGAKIFNEQDKNVSSQKVLVGLI